MFEKIMRCHTSCSSLSKPLTRLYQLYRSASLDAGIQSLEEMTRSGHTYYPPITCYLPWFSKLWGLLSLLWKIVHEDFVLWSMGGQVSVLGCRTLAALLKICSIFLRHSYYHAQLDTLAAFARVIVKNSPSVLSSKWLFVWGDVEGRVRRRRSTNIN
jgi:hypothetical protein